MQKISPNDRKKQSVKFMRQQRFQLLNCARKHVIVFLAVFAVCFFSACRTPFSSRGDHKAVAGVLDLRSWDFSHNGQIDIRGTWEFTWESLCSDTMPDTEQKKPPAGTIEVPSAWIDRGTQNPAYPVYGYATYRLKILMPEHTPSLSLRIPPSDTAIIVSANGKDIFANGRVGKNKTSSKPLYYAPVCRELPQTPVIELCVRMSNYDFPRPGMRDCYILGKTDVLLAEAENELILNIFIIGAMFIMAMYHLGLYYQRRSDLSALFFALLCISTLSRLLVTGGGYAYHFSWFTWEMGSKVEYLSLIGWALGLLCMKSFYPKDVSMKIVIPVFALICVLSTFVLFTPVMIFTRLLFVFDLLSIFIIIYFNYILIKTVFLKREYSVIFAIGVAVFAITIINDMLLGYRLINSVYMMPYGLFIFFFVQSYILSLKFSKAFTAVESLSRTLETRVIERTEELELERNRLHAINITMDKEIDLARNIQEQLLPLKSPVPYISTVYHPMQKVGGDFFDFISFQDSDKIGIFLCDVAGHGVSAAFITSMVKTILLQAGNNKNDPAEMITYLNEILFSNSAGYYCTAFYGIYSKTERSITYVSAGHCFPFIIDDGGIRTLEGKNGMLIGAFDNRTLDKLHKGYSSTKVILPSESKLLIYTDGLTEARPMDGEKMFYIDAGLNEILMKNRKMPCGNFTEELLRSLIAFRGGDKFEDDVAIICLDIE